MYTLTSIYLVTSCVGLFPSRLYYIGVLEQVSKNGLNYVWDNVEGACYYGQDSDAFPLTRGLILHGGIRFAAATAEHGLYYDTEWDVLRRDCCSCLSLLVRLSRDISGLQLGS